MKHLVPQFLLLCLIINSSVLLNAQQVTTGTSSFTTKAKYSNRQVVWYEDPYWLDGSYLGDPKNKDKFNDILFKKVGSKYYKAQSYDFFNIEDWGLKRKTEEGNSEKNIKLFQAMVDYFPKDYFPVIYIPSGEWELASSLELKNSVKLFGQGANLHSRSGTRIFFTGKKQGIISWGSYSVFNDFALFGSSASQGLNDGLALRSITTIERVHVKGFSNNGIGFWANLEEKTNASGSYVANCVSAENGNDGFFFGRVDGNAMSIIGCDARDNGRYGFNEDSFLGNNLMSCMAHYNKKGDYFVRDKANARSTFIGCYSEGGSPVSQFSPNTKVVGGIWGSGYTLNGKDVLH